MQTRQQVQVLLWSRRLAGWRWELAALFGPLHPILASTCTCRQSMLQQNCYVLDYGITLLYPRSRAATVQVYTDD
jgi:hypothetical protein